MLNLGDSVFLYTGAVSRVSFSDLFGPIAGVTSQYVITSPANSVLMVGLVSMEKDVYNSYTLVVNFGLYYL